MSITTNANRPELIATPDVHIRKIIKTRGHFPTEDAALKLLWLALMRAEKKWTYPIKDWPQALHQFAIYFPGRVPVAS